MTKEKLLEWGLTEEQATKVMEGLNGSFVTKARFNEVNTELTTAKNTIKERDTQLETLKKASGDTKALQDQITQLQADNKKKDTDHAAELKNLKISNAVELALTGAKAKNNTAVKALLSKTSTIIFSLRTRTLTHGVIRKCADSAWMKSKERTGELILKMRC